MDVEEEVLKVKRKLEKVMKGGKTSEPTIVHLKRLQTLPITLDILTKTRIGMTVNSLRKTAGDEAVQSTAKTLIKDWKKFIAPTSKDSGVTPASEENSREASDAVNKSVAGEAGSGEASNGSSAPKQETSTQPPAQSRFERNEVSFPPKAVTTDAVRLKCREMLANALRSEEFDDVMTTPEEKAAELEQAIFDVSSRAFSLGFPSRFTLAMLDHTEFCGFNLDPLLFVMNSRLLPVVTS
jgi:transcription elongation factor S-II